MSNTYLDPQTGVAYRDGIVIEKGVALTTDFLEKNESSIQKMLDHWVSYPDCFLDDIAPATCPIKLFFYQRIFLRACMRYRYHTGTFTRAFSKSFLAILAYFLRCIFLPHSKVVLCSAYKNASIKILQQKLDEIVTFWPLLGNEILTKKSSTDYIELTFKNASTFNVVSMAASARGQRSTAIIVEEGVLIDGTDFNEIVLPMASVNRRDELGRVNEREPHQAQTFITSAGPKTCFMYEKLIELAVMSIIKPEFAFVWGGDYRVPVAMGLLSNSFLEDQRLSPTYSEESFAREYMSIWTGNNTDSWFNSNKLLSKRNLLKCERKRQIGLNDKEAYYIIGVDVARSGANTAIIIVKVYPNPEGFKKNVVNVVVLNNMPMQLQAVEIKKIVADYLPKEIIVDATGLGFPLIDLLVIPTTDPATGMEYPPMRVINKDVYDDTIKDKSIVPILWVFKANPGLNTEVNSSCYSQISNGSVHFLANERIVKTRLLATKKWQKKGPYEVEKFLLPYAMTSRLIDEMNNLRLRPSTSGNIEVEQISRRILKDRYSALGYALWRVKSYEDDAMKRKNKKGKNIADFLKFTPKTNNNQRRW